MSSRRVARPVLAVVLALFWAVVCTYAIAFVGLSAPELGFIWAGLVYALGLVAAAFVWGGPRRPVALAVAGVFALGLGLLAWYTLPPSHERIEKVADQVAVPDDWSMVADSQSGNGWCFQGCPEVDRDYELPAGTTYDDARDELVAELDDEGWDRTRAIGGETDALTRGRWRVAIQETFDGLFSLAFSG